MSLLVLHFSEIYYGPLSPHLPENGEHSQVDQRKDHKSVKANRSRWQRFGGRLIKVELADTLRRTNQAPNVVQIQQVHIVTRVLRTTQKGHGYM